MRRFRFLDPGSLVDGDLHLVLAACQPADPKRGFVPSYSFTMYAPSAPPNGLEAGSISLRVARDHMLYISGHIAYNVAESFRGQHFAGRACKLILPLARRHGLNPLCITCDPENIPSRKTCEWLGARLLEIVPVPPEHILYAAGQRQKCRYLLTLNGDALSS
jgi:predicted acetyltransferase